MVYSYSDLPSDPASAWGSASEKDSTWSAWLCYSSGVRPTLWKNSSIVSFSYWCSKGAVASILGLSGSTDWGADVDNNSLFIQRVTPPLHNSKGRDYGLSFCSPFSYWQLLADILSESNWTLRWIIRWIWSHLTWVRQCSEMKKEDAPEKHCSFTWSLSSSPSLRPDLLHGAQLRLALPLTSLETQLQLILMDGHPTPWKERWACPSSPVSTRIFQTCRTIFGSNVIAGKAKLRQKGNETLFWHLKRIDHSFPFFQEIRSIVCIWISLPEMVKFQRCAFHNISKSESSFPWF